MNKSFLLSVAFLFVGAATICAQDIIVLKTGEEIEAKVVKIGDSEIEYKKWSNQEGPSYTAQKGKIFMIKYQNGDKDIFNDVNDADAAANSSVHETTQPYQIKLPVDERNNEIIELYSEDYLSAPMEDAEKLKKRKAEPSKRVQLYWGVQSDSEISNSEVEVTIVPSPACSDAYYIRILNKTDANIYIDKGSSFRVDTKGIAKPYYDASVKTLTTGGASGGAVNLGGVANAMGVGGAVGALAGGITVGGGKSSSTSTTYAQERFLAIPPYSSSFIEEDNIVQTKGPGLITDAEYQNMGNHEDLLIASSRINISKYDCVKYNEAESPYKINIVITYSIKHDFSTYSRMTLKLYVKHMYGSGKNEAIRAIQHKKDASPLLYMFNDWGPDYKLFDLNGKDLTHCLSVSFFND